MPSARSEIEAVVSRDRLSLEDWLVHTGFHDDNYREQELSRYRALREAIRAVDQQAKELEENLLQLRLRHIQVYKKHIEMEQQEADLLSRLDQLRQNRANTTAEPLPPIVLPPLEETTAGSSQDAPMEEGEIPHAMVSGNLLQIAASWLTTKTCSVINHLTRYVLSSMNISSSMSSPSSMSKLSSMSNLPSL